jgi:hypothetical protein
MEASDNMHVNLSWLKLEERLTSSLLVLVRSIDMLNAPECCIFKLLGHSSDTHAYPTRHATRAFFHKPHVQNRLWEEHSTT